MASQLSTSEINTAEAKGSDASQVSAPSGGGSQFTTSGQARPVQPQAAVAAAPVSNSFSAIEGDDGRAQAPPSVTASPSAAPSATLGGAGGAASGSVTDDTLPTGVPGAEPALEQDFFETAYVAVAAPVERDNTYVAPLPLETLPPQPVAPAPAPAAAPPQPAFNLADIPTEITYDGGTLPEVVVVEPLPGLREFLVDLGSMVASLGRVRAIDAGGMTVYAGGALAYMSAMQDRAQQIQAYAQGGISAATLQYLKSEVNAWFSSLNAVSMQSQSHIETVRDGVVRAVRDGLAQDDDVRAVEDRYFELRREMLRAQDSRTGANSASA